MIREFSTLNQIDYYSYFTVVQMMLNLLNFLFTVLSSIAYIYGLIIRSLLTANSELLSLKLYSNYPQGVVPAL